MKKLFAVLLAVVMVFSAVAILASCNKIGADVQKAIDRAQNMTLEELEAAAQEEFENAGVRFEAASSTSGVGKLLSEFKKKYEWFNYPTFSSMKDSDSYKAIEKTVAKGNFWADFALLQEGASFMQYANAGYLLNYVPTDDSITLDPKETAPLVGLYADKLFLYNNSLYTDNTLTNVWQLTGKPGANGKTAMPGVSIQGHAKERINLTFYAMMTSDAGVRALKEAYEEYFGTPYVENSNYKNIGYYFISELITHGLKNRHDSDSKVASDKNQLPGNSTGMVYVVGLNKTKSYANNTTDNTYVWEDEIFVSGVGEGHTVKGFDGLTYKFFITIPATSRLPYTACLLARYLLTKDGFMAGWADEGYYSANQQLTAQVLGKKYSINTTNTLMEDPAYVASIYDDIDRFVTSLWNN